MFRLFFVALAAAVIVAVGTQVAIAATLQYELVYGESYDSNDQPAGYSLTGPDPIFPGTIAPTDYHRFEFRITITDAAADEALFYLQAEASGPGWEPLAWDTGAAPNPSFNPPGPTTPNRGLWQLFNAGVSDDLDALTAITDTASESWAAYHYRPGQVPQDGDDLGTSTYLGDLYLFYTGGDTPGVYTLTLGGDQVEDRFRMWKGGSTTSATVNIVSYDDNVLSDTFSITIVPEPSSLILMTLAVVLLSPFRQETIRSGNADLT